MICVDGCLRRWKSSVEHLVVGLQEAFNGLFIQKLILLKSMACSSVPQVRSFLIPSSAHPWISVWVPFSATYRLEQAQQLPLPLEPDIMIDLMRNTSRNLYKAGCNKHPRRPCTFLANGLGELHIRWQKHRYLVRLPGLAMKKEGPRL